MNILKYQRLSEEELLKLTGGNRRWVHVDTVVVESSCVKYDDKGNCLVEWVVTRQTWQKVNSRGEIIKTEYRPD